MDCQVKPGNDGQERRRPDNWVYPIGANLVLPI